MVNGFDRTAMISIAQTDEDRARLAAAPIGDTSDDGTDYAGIVVPKPWGREWQLFRNQEFSAWRLEINAGKETSTHCHEHKTTILFVVAGSVELFTLSKRFRMTVGDAMIIEPGVFHRTASAAGAVVMEVESPTNKRDLVRIEDRYGRAGMGYEQCA